MPGQLTNDIIKGPPPPPIDRGWGGDGSDGERGSFRRASFAGLVILMIATAMVFAAFIAAFIARRGASPDWVGTPKPRILLINTGVLLLSSFVLDFSRRALKNRHRGRFNVWWSVATGLGILFLAGQGLAWSQLAASGVWVASNPGSSFFYLLTATHAFHLLGGVAALIWVDIQALRLQLGPAKRTAIDITAVYWHFLDALWLVLMALFYVWG